MTVIYSPQSKDDFAKMEIFVSGGRNGSITAMDIVQKIREKVSDLEIFPKRYAFWKETEYRFFSAKNFLVFYRYDEAADTIIVERIIYARRDIDTLL